MDLNMISKMQQAQKEMKDRLSEMVVEGTAENGKIKVKADGNKNIIDVSIDESIMKEYDAEGLGELITVAVNKALKEADKVSESELRGIAGQMLPFFPGMG